MWMIFVYGLLALSFINAHSSHDDITNNESYLKMENMCSKSSEERKRMPTDNNNKIIKNTVSEPDFNEDVEAIDINRIKSLSSTIVRRIERELLKKMNEQLNKWNELPENESRKDTYNILIVMGLYGFGFVTGILSAKIYYVTLY